MIRGTLTIATVPALYRQLPKLLFQEANEEESHFTLDCSAVTSADSAAIGLLVEIDRLLAEKGRELKLEGLNEHLTSLAKIYGVDWVLV